MKSNNTIEINGNLYDAKTGAPISQKTATKNISQPKKQASTQTKYVDGFSRPVSASIKRKHKIVSTEKKIAVPVAKERSHTPTPSMKRAVNRSLTLNRNAVKQPVKVAAKSPVSESNEVAVSSTAFKHADSARFKRASQVAKSASVAKFNHAPKSRIEPTPVNSSTLTKHLAKTHDTPAVSTEKSPKEQLVAKVMASSVVTSTTKHKKAKKHSHLGRYATSGLVALVLVGYVAYLNVPSISMKVAAHRAGFAAAMPGYKPAGYSLKGPIAYSPGQVTVNFQSNTDNRTFSLKQQPTTWDSTALLENYVVKQNPNYLTYQDRGLTIYIYEGSSASWVNGGKLYNLEAKDAQLDTDQLLKLATSV